MNLGKVYFDFEYLKRNYECIPSDALLRYIKVDNETGEIEITFYTKQVSSDLWPSEYRADQLRKLELK